MEYKSRDAEAVKCMECGGDITYGRADKKFCCEECKNRYHNRKTVADKVLKTRINGILMRNYRILDSLVRAGIDSVALMEILNMGFIPGFVTSCTKTRNRIEYGCYDIRYVMSQHKVFSISRIGNISLNLRTVVKTELI